MSKELQVKFAGITFENPITTASGTFGSGMEYSEFVDLSKLGAVTTKGVADHPWEGNQTPRVVETSAGMLNAIGLQNPGIETFISRDLPFLKEHKARVIVNVCGHSEEEYLNVVRRLAEADVKDDVDMLEINISCPNVKEGGIAFGQKPEMAESITKKIKEVAYQPVIMKLSPNVTDITEMARAVEAGGADGVSLINTLTGMKIDVRKKTFALANQTGGMSGPAVHPIAVRMVYQVAQAVDLPIIGMGGVQSTDDALELMMAGATMVAVGTANFYHPTITTEIIDGLQRYAETNKLSSINEIVGCVK